MVVCMVRIKARMGVGDVIVWRTWTRVDRLLAEPRGC